MPALAHRFDVPDDHVAVGTGSVGVCQQIVQAVAGHGDEVVFAWRSFEAYPIIVAISGRPGRARAPGRDERHDLDAMAAAITDRTRLVLVCNPNNPTGTAVRRAELEAFLDRVPSDTLVVIDEAYREFIRDPDIPDGLDLYRDRPNVAVLRTFSKAYGLAALRVGFAVAHEPVAAALRKTAVPFGVSTLAQHAAVASLDAENELSGPGRCPGRGARHGSWHALADAGLATARRAGQLRLAAAGRTNGCGRRGLRRRRRRGAALHG